MIHNVQYYHDVINNFSEQDIKSCNYDYYQHNVNLYCYLSKLYKDIKSEFNIQVNDIEPLDFVNKKLNEVNKYLYEYKDKVIQFN